MNVFFFIIISAFLPLTAYAETIKRVSVNSNGEEGNNASTYPKVSSDGNIVLYLSYATNLDQTCSNCIYYSRDVRNSNTKGIEKTQGMLAGLDDAEIGKKLSSDGRYLVFSSGDSDVVPGDTNGVFDIFRKDLSNDAIIRVSVGSAGVQADNESRNPSISANGRFIVFQSAATNLVAGDSNGNIDIFLHDIQNNITERVSVKPDGSELNVDSTNASVSENGNRITFQAADGVDSNDNNNSVDIFVRDRTLGATSCLSVNYWDQKGNNDSVDAVITPSGRYVVFESLARNLVNIDTNEQWDIFVRDILLGSTYLVSKNTDGTQGDAMSYTADISDDGRYVAFLSDADTLDSLPHTNTTELFVHDRENSETVRASVSNKGMEANGDSLSCAISGNGRFVFFSSWASNLVQNDNNGKIDVFRKLSPFKVKKGFWPLFLPAITHN